MEINDKAPAVVRKEIVINALPEEVWDIHTDINGWSDWNPDIASSKLQGPLAVGTVFSWKSRGMNITSTIQEIEPSNRIGWTGTGFGARARHIWTLEPNGKGTLIKTEESLEGWLVTLLKGRMRKNLETSLNAWLIDLKNEVEMASNGKHV